MDYDRPGKGTPVTSQMLSDLELLALQHLLKLLNRAEITQCPGENYLFQDLFSKFKSGSNTNPRSSVYAIELL